MLPWEHLLWLWFCMCICLSHVRIFVWFFLRFCVSHHSLFSPVLPFLPPHHARHAPAAPTLRTLQLAARSLPAQGQPHIPTLKPQYTGREFKQAWALKAHKLVHKLSTNSTVMHKNQAEKIFSLPRHGSKWLYTLTIGNGNSNNKLNLHGIGIIVWVIYCMPVFLSHLPPWAKFLQVFTLNKH